MNLHDIASRKFRDRRMNLFMSLVGDLTKPATLLDVGGTTDFWRDRIPQGVTITLFNLFDQEALPGMNVMVGDGCDLSRFKDKSFDVVFSNSVLCLVGGPQRQEQMAREIRRVGQRYFVQTANQNFPLDWRTLMPFFHWLPASTQAWWFERVPVGRYHKARNPEEAMNWATRVCDLTVAKCVELFPEGTIVPERVAGMTKSIMIHSRFSNH